MRYTLISLRRKNQKLLKVGKAEREVPKISKHLAAGRWTLNKKS